MKVTCENCKNDVEVSMYFNNARITTQKYMLNFKEFYTAIIDGKAICPLCGNHISEIFHKQITDDDILWLTTGERR